MIGPHTEARDENRAPIYHYFPRVVLFSDLIYRWLLERPAVNCKSNWEK